MSEHIAEEIAEQVSEQVSEEIADQISEEIAEEVAEIVNDNDAAILMMLSNILAKCESLESEIFRIRIESLRTPQTSIAEIIDNPARSTLNALQDAGAVAKEAIWK